MHVLILGCGYLGERVARALRQQGDAVSALTRSSAKAEQWRHDGIRPILGDVMDPKSLQALSEADACFYAIGFDRSAPFDKRSVYVDGLRNVLNAVNARVPRLLYVSSTSVYGQDQGEIITEQSPCEPTSEGGEICLAAERLVNEFAARAGGENRAQVLRLSGIYGPGRLIGRIDQLRQQVPIPASPDAWLNLIHVADATQAVVRLLQEPPRSPLYLLSDEEPLPRREFYGELARLVGAPPPVFAAGNDFSFNKRCDSSLIRADLGLRLQFPSAREGLADALKDARLRG